jgi:peroxiredoxin
LLRFHFEARAAKKRAMTLFNVYGGILFYGFVSVASTAATVSPNANALAGSDLITGKKTPLIEVGKTATVVVFMSARCPCSKSHEATLKNLATQFPKVRFIGVHSNQDEPESEAKAHFEKIALPFPVLQDVGANIANHLGALKTPHTFILDSKGNKLFSGGVDDSHLAQNSKKQYLVAALNAVVEGRKPDPAEVRTLGCIIQR